ncbi:MAG: hypothetical protein LBS59_00755 [Puniceicoccales bacterium]|nr:hypothetical protein [Puniceicoccales bacterium]
MKKKKSFFYPLVHVGVAAHLAVGMFVYTHWNNSASASGTPLAVASAITVADCKECPPLPVLNPVRDTTLAEFRKGFAAPGRDYSTGPLWVWNDRLTKEQVVTTLRDLASQKVKQVWVHPRPGLMTPYLSEEWFDLWKIALDEAVKLDMNIWIYDENSYPSGFAGGLVPEAMPESRGMSLVFGEVAEVPKIDKNIWYVFDPENKNITNVAKKAGKLKPLPNGKKYLVARAHYVAPSGWYGGKWHVDLLKRGVTEKFLDITLDAYKNVPEIAKEFGRRVPGIFTDEPHPVGIRFAGIRSSLPWNEDFCGEFQKRFKYSLADSVPSLVKEIGDWKRVRHNYHQLVLDLFIERFAKPYSERCEKYGLQFTGHYWEHGWPGTSNGPDNMAMYFWMQRPAIDLLMNQYNDSSAGAQFGNVRSVKELSSAANQTGRARTLSENYGAGGWDMRLEDMKRLGDWSYALGVNTNNEHLSYVTIRGARKRDHPQSFSYHAPWFAGYHVVAEHFTRISHALSQGRQINKILIIEPTTTAWFYQGKKELGRMGSAFTKLVTNFEQAQVEYDLASEDILKRIGSVKGRELRVGQASYDLVILPPFLENLNAPTLKLLRAYAKNGGRLFYIGDKPVRVDGAGANIVLDGKKVTDGEVLAIAKERTAKTGVFVEVPEGTRTIFHHRRKLADAEILFVNNTDFNRSIAVKIKTGKYLSRSEDGKIYDSLPVRGGAGKNVYEVELPPVGHAVFVLTDKPVRDGEKAIVFSSDPTPVNGTPLRVENPKENVLVLDYVDVSAGGETRKGVHTWSAGDFVFRKHGFGGNPWDNQVQFRDELIKKRFSPDSGFEAEYHFNLRDAVPKNLHIVVERADLYEITLNGKRVSAVPNAWWLDRSFGKIDISKVTRTGRNTLKIKAYPFRIEHEIEAVYLVGDFSLENAAKGFNVVPVRPLSIADQDTLSSERHNEAINGVAWLSNGIGFSPSGKEDRAPVVRFNLGGEKTVTGIRIWNYNEVALKQRGAKEVEITGLGKVTLPIGNGRPVDLFFESPKELSAVEVKILSNHYNVRFPVAAGATVPDNAFVGLAEVRILGKEKSPIQGVKVVATSELFEDGHNRRAAYLVDGSGLGSVVIASGWNLQGMPFYSDKVVYSRSFNVDKVDRDSTAFFVQLPPSPSGWYGATARIVVNGKSAGFVMSAPWQVKVTDLLRAGANEISVEVYGTPKNLLGPFHIGRVRGTAWPGHFKRAPKNQPGGASYDNISYGLFAPFELLSAEIKK